MKLLIAEDDPRLLKSLVHIFRGDGYAADGVDNGADAYEYAKTGEYDGFVLDIMMPGMDGLTLLSRLRREGITAPALFLSARTEVDDRIEGLDAGADDYLPKPFSIRELLARVRAMLRRKETFTPDLLQKGNTQLNRSTFELSCEGKSVGLGGKEFQIMEMLMLHFGQILSTEQLMTHIWGWDTEVDTSVIWVHISNLRKKMESVGSSLSVRFVRGAGYLLEENR